MYNLEIKIIHDVPKQHTIEHSSGTRILTRSERQLFLEYGPLKSGAFSPKEDKIILNNWQKFCEVCPINITMISFIDELSFI